MEKKPFERIELKILRLCDNIQLINNRIKLIPFNFTKSNPDRYVNSIYYDSHDLKLFHSNIFGLSPRFKIRLRWYNDLLETRNFNLERKSKQGSVGTKYQKPIDLDINKVDYCRKKIKDLNVPIQIGFNRRFDPSHKKLKLSKIICIASSGVNLCCSNNFCKAFQVNFVISKCFDVTFVCSNGRSHRRSNLQCDF